MLSLYLWIYTLILAILWGLFIIVKIHAYKFKNFSNNIEKITNILLFFLIFLSLLWYIIIFMSTSNTTVKVVDYSWVDTREVNY